MVVKRVKSGIKELDKMLNGGVPEGNAVVITGGLGTGKTTFIMQFLYNAAKAGNRCLFVSLEENPVDIIEQSASYGWDVEKLVKSGMIIFQQHIELDYESLEISIENILRKYKDVKFVAVDPISMLKIYFKSDTGFRVALFHMFQLFKKYNVTAFLIDDESEPSAGQFVSDGVILLSVIKKDTGMFRTLEILKMRKTQHDLEPINYKITSKGIEFY
ncbi:hypothetical protein H0N95_01230 [Candidatus Micrarchaeota archaeon]|nr:hypothetical protein [Candidatus Micrarchaeota archaeon]